MGSILFIILVVIGVFVIGITGYLIALYNKLITLRVKVETAFSDIDVQLKRRHDLIPNLVETVKGYAKHEKELLEEVTKARASAMKAYDTAKESDAQAGKQDTAEMYKEAFAAESKLSGAIGNLFAVAENYPDLKASQNFQQLQSELSQTEDKIERSRRFYNGTVKEYNTKISLFPNNLVAGIFGFKSKVFFELDDEKERENVKVSF